MNSSDDYAYPETKAGGRWRVGHRCAFFPITQGLIISLMRFQTALIAYLERSRTAREDLEACNSARDICLAEADSALQSATYLLWGAAAAIQFTGDFTETEYNESVRPSMNIIEKFSGILSLDHAYLVRLVKRLSPLFADLPSSLHPNAERFSHALGIMYDIHILVCGNFGGDAGPSLRMSKDSTKTSIEVLEDYKWKRLGAVQSGAARLRCPFSHGGSQPPEKEHHP
jgi:hypothetical protein